MPETGKVYEDVTEEEIISMVKEGHEQGVLESSEAEMIHNIFEFDEKEDLIYFSSLTSSVMRLRESVKDKISDEGRIGGYRVYFSERI